MVFAAIGFSIPIFWLGFILIWVFGLWAFGLDNPILPVAGYSLVLTMAWWTTCVTWRCLRSALG